MLSDNETTRLSKFLSLVLRHQPEVLGIPLDSNGWTDVPILLEKLRQRGYTISLDQLKHVVESNAKKRFAFNAEESGVPPFSRIRANQGHSVTVELGYVETLPPTLLYHGTATRFLKTILTEGLRKMNRHHVHLSADKQTAVSVGSRHGKPVVLVVRAGDMATDGHIFYQSENGVWLTDHVPAAYLSHD